MKTKGILNLRVRRVSDIQRAIYFNMSRYEFYRANGQPSEIRIEVKPRAKRASRLK